ncbi:MAG: hypothetical protein ACYDCC_03015 [Actinomycetota bacterium]
MRPASGLSGGQDLPEQDPNAAFAPPDEFSALPQARDEPELPEPQGRAAASLQAKITLLSERMRAQEANSARLQSGLDRVESQVMDIAKRSQPMLETLSAELARQGALLESLRTDVESSLDLHAQRVSEFEQRLASVLREMRELIAAKLESYDLAVTDRLQETQQFNAERLADFQEQVEGLVRAFASQAIPEEMRAKVEELSSRFVFAETALAATRSSVEFLRSEVGQLTMVVRKLQP